MATPPSSGTGRTLQRSPRGRDTRLNRRASPLQKWVATTERTNATMATGRMNFIAGQPRAGGSQALPGRSLGHPPPA